MLNRKPKVNDTLVYQCHGNKKIYTVVGYFGNHKDDAILNIKADGEDTTQIIWRFANGETNKLLSFKEV
jgi:hypothetical protein